MSIPFTAPSTDVDVKMIAAGGTCSSTALTETTGLKLAATGVTTLVRVGGNGVPQKIEALPEQATPPATGSSVRFLHVMPGFGQLDVGLGPANVTNLPTTLETPFLTAPVSFGQVPPTGENTLEGKAVQADGYVPVLQSTFHFVAAVHGTSPENALLIWNVMPQNGSQFTLYMAGVQRDNSHPPRGFACNEANPPPPATVDAYNNPNANPLLVNCTPTTLSGISVDVFTTSLYGPNSPAFSDREQAIEQTTMGQNPVFSRNSDIMCFSELDFPQDIQALITGGGPADAGSGPGRFPYNYWVQTTVSTPATDPTDINGNTPAPPAAAPCANPMLATDLQKLFTCMEANCDTSPGQGAGTLPGSTACLSNSCSGEFAPFLLNSANNGCFDCIIDYVASDQEYVTAQTACETGVQQPYGFNGQLSNLILSRYPLKNQAAFILPSSQYRQGVLYSQVELEDQTIDFYCGFFTSTLVAGDLPYVGNYGNDGDPNSVNSGGAYANEQLLQA